METRLIVSLKFQRHSIRCKSGFEVKSVKKRRNSRPGRGRRLRIEEVEEEKEEERDGDSAEIRKLRMAGMKIDRSSVGPSVCRYVGRVCKRKIFWIEDQKGRDFK